MPKELQHIVSPGLLASVLSVEKSWNFLLALWQASSCQETRTRLYMLSLKNWCSLYYIVLYSICTHTHTHTCVHNMHSHICNHKTCICWSKHNNSGIMFLVLGVGSKMFWENTEGGNMGTKGTGLKTMNPGQTTEDHWVVAWCNQLYTFPDISPKIRWSWVFLSFQFPLQGFFTVYGWPHPSAEKLLATRTCQCRYVKAEVEMKLQEPLAERDWLWWIWWFRSVIFFQLYNRSISRGGPKCAKI